MRQLLKDQINYAAGLLAFFKSKSILVVDLLEASSADSASTEKKERVWFSADIPQELGLPDEAAGAFDSFF